MPFTTEEFENYLTAEADRQTAEAACKHDPKNVDNLISWGKALIDCSQYQSTKTAKLTLEDAESKFVKALALSPGKAEALWFIGNASINAGFITPDLDEAQPYFDKAADYFQRAWEANPGNEHYFKSLEFKTKAPKWHKQMHKHQDTTESEARKASSVDSNSKVSKKKNTGSGFRYLGWGLLAVGLLVWLGRGKFRAPSVPK